MFTMLTTAFITATVGLGFLSQVSDNNCGGGLGQWSVPINTLLLIVLAAMNYATRKRVSDVKNVTDKVAMRSTDRQGKVDLKIKKESDR